MLFSPFGFGDFPQRPAQSVFADDLAHPQDLGTNAITA